MIHFSFLDIFLLANHMRFQGGSPPPLEKLGVRVPPLDFFKVITLKAFDLEQVIYDHRQVGQPMGRMGMHPKRLASISDNSALNAINSSRQRN